MRVRLDELRQVIREEFMHGVPEWQLRQDSADFVDSVRNRIKRYILVNKSDDLQAQREAITAMNVVCDELEKKVYDLLDDQLFNFMRRV